MQPKLTCLVTCKNERMNIRPCIESVRELADEILVADSGSTDGTLEIVRSLGGCRIIEREYVHAGDFKNWAIPQASHPWILVLDADERVTPELADEIRGLLETGPSQDGYWVYRKNHFMGHPVTSCGWGRECCLRFFHRDRARYVGSNDHAEVHVSTGRVGKLRQRLIHYSFWSFDQYFTKFHRYSKVQAQLWHEAGRRPSWWQLLSRPVYRFVRDFVFQGGFLDGKVGLQIAMLAAFYSFMKEARLWELDSAMPQTDPEQDGEGHAASATKRQFFERLNVSAA